MAPEYKNVTFGDHQVKPKDFALCLDKFRLGLLSYIGILLMFAKGIRDGITQAVKGYSKANNQYMKKQYNPDEKRIYLQCLEANNFYG